MLELNMQWFYSEKYLWQKWVEEAPEKSISDHSFWDFWSIMLPVVGYL